MSNTKTEILAILKRSGAHTVGQLAEALHLAPVTIRQHLTRLEADGLVLAEQRTNGSGRPHYEFRLSAKAHAAAFPGRSDRLVELLVREVGRLDGAALADLSAQERMSMVVARVASRLADEYVPLLEGWPLQERVSFAAGVMHADGGFAEWEKTERGYEIRDFNCLFRRLLGEDAHGNICDWHSTFLSRMLGAEVSVGRCPDASPQCCRYVVASAVPAAR